MQEIRFYEDSYQFQVIKSDPEMKFTLSIEVINQTLKQVELYRSPSRTGSLWATVVEDGQEVRRYKLTKLGLYRMDYVSKGWEEAGI